MIEGVSVATMKETQRLAPTRKTPQHKRITYNQGEGNNVMEIKIFPVFASSWHYYSQQILFIIYNIEDIRYIPR